tara:strand:+ start:1697 stop:1996 length:300 start_codon:yes stop_codon:yes gene_type:complete
MRGLKALVIGMGVLIVVGLVFLIYAIVQKSGDRLGGGFGADTAPTVSSVVLPAGAEVMETRVGTDRIVLRLRLPDGSGRLVVLDAATGRLVGQTDLIFR